MFPNASYFSKDVFKETKHIALSEFSSLCLANLHQIFFVETHIVFNGRTPDLIES